MENTERTAYDIAYLNNEIDLHALLFVKLNEMEQYDVCSLIDEYMRHSEIRQKMDEGNKDNKGTGGASHGFSGGIPEGTPRQ